MKKNTDLVGKVVKIDEVQYLIDKVTTSDGRNNENSSANIQKFRIELITLDFLTEANQKINELVAKPIQDFVPKEKIKGIAIEFSEEQLHNKVTTTKALCKAFAIGIMDAKHLVDAANHNTILIEIPNIEKLHMFPMTYLKDIVRLLEEHLPKNNFTANFYY